MDAPHARTARRVRARRARRRVASAALIAVLALTTVVGAVFATRMSGGSTGPVDDHVGPASSGPTPGLSPSSTPSPTRSPTPTTTSPTPPPPVAAPPEEPAPPPEPVCADDVLVCVNIARVANGLGELSADGTLNAAAQECADRMASTGQMTHSSGGPGGFSYWGENIAMGYPSAAAVFDGWMNSAGHRANILNPDYTAMGIGYASGNWWCQQFGG